VLDKSVLVLDAVEDGAGTLSELTAASGLSRATAHRLAVALEKHGLLGRDATGRFVLGARLVGLGRAAAEGLPLVAAARAALVELRDATGESAQLYVRDGDRRVCLESLQSPHGLRTIVPVGAVLPLDRGSAGKVLLDRDTAVRSRGWAESVAEREAGVASVSAAVRDHDGRVVAAVSVSGPIQRTTRQPARRYREAVLAAARAVERAAGFAR
jgi:DNA-binding IclR family transcriptional regulator